MDTPPKKEQKALSRVEWLMARVGDGGPAVNRHWVERIVCWACVVGELASDRVHLAFQQTQGIHTMLCQCWPTCSTLAQH